MGRTTRGVASYRLVNTVVVDFSRRELFLSSGSSSPREQETEQTFALLDAKEGRAFLLRTPVDRSTQRKVPEDLILSTLRAVKLFCNIYSYNWTIIKMSQ